MAYPYLAPPGFRMHDSSLSEIQAIAQLRAGEGESWQATERDWDEYERKLRRENMAIWAGMLVRDVGDGAAL